MPRIEDVIKSVLMSVKNLLGDVYDWTSQYESLTSREEILNELNEIQYITGRIFATLSPTVQEPSQEETVKSSPSSMEGKPSETMHVEKPFLEVRLEDEITPPFDMVLDVLKPGVEGSEVAEILEKVKTALSEKIRGLHPIFFKMTKAIAMIRRKSKLTQQDIDDLKQLVYQWSIQARST